MTRPVVLMTGAYPDRDLAEMAARYRLLKLWEAPDPAALVAEHGQEVRAIATRGDLGASADLMRALPALEIVACFGVGTDGIDLDHARAAGIWVTNTPDVLTDDVADLAVGLLLATARQIPPGDAFVRARPLGAGTDAADDAGIGQAGRDRGARPDRRGGSRASTPTSPTSPGTRDPRPPGPMSTTWSRWPGARSS